eukprot:scaffold2256_cov166-Amphora_coffeaeformis.AAC.8
MNKEQQQQNLQEVETELEETSLLKAKLTDDLLGRVFAFLMPQGLSTTARDTSSLDGVRHLIPVCRRFRQILYDPVFWKQALVGITSSSSDNDNANDNNEKGPTKNKRSTEPAPCVGQSVLLATPLADNGFHFHGFRRLTTLAPDLPHEQRFLVQEHASGRRLVLSLVTIEPDHAPCELVEQLQVLGRLKLMGKLADFDYFKVGISVEKRLFYVRIMDETLAHHLQSDKFRSDTVNNSSQTHLWENRHGSLPELRQKWPALVDWIFEISLVFKLEIDTMFRAAQLVQRAYSRASPQIQLFSTQNAQLVAAASTFVTALLDEKAENRLSLTDLQHSLDNRWTTDAIWSCVKILLTLHADCLGEPTLLDFILVYFCHDDPTSLLAPDVTRRTVTLAMLAQCSTLMEEHPTRVAAACVCSLARFPVEASNAAAMTNTEIWSDYLANYTRLPWESLPLEPARRAIQQVLATPRLLMSKFAHDLTSVAHLAFLPSMQDLELYRQRGLKRKRLEA